MKVFILLLSCTAAVLAESPVYYSRFVRFQRVEQAPYPAAGYLPPGQEFRPPQRQTGYAPPAAYGPPPTMITTAAAAEEGADATTTEIPTTTEASTEQEYEQIRREDDNGNEKVSERQEEEFTEQGVYYIYHPNGLLQRVVYSTKNDVQNMGYTAQLRYKDVEPIKEPIYTYDPETYVLRQIKL